MPSDLLDWCRPNHHPGHAHILTGYCAPLRIQ
jgi:hypothetical protein